MSSKQQPASLYQGKNLTAVVLALAWPTIVEQIFQTVVQYVDSAMVGRIGANASAAVRESGAVIVGHAPSPPRRFWSPWP